MLTFHSYIIYMGFRFLLFIIIFAVVEYYSFIVVRSALRLAPPAVRISLLAIYILISLACWGSFFILRNEQIHLPKGLQNLYVAITVGMIVGKALILVIMLGDDVRRLLVWSYYKITNSPVVAAETGGGVTRSVFLSRLALLLGGGMLAGFVQGISNRYKYQVKKIKLTFNNLPASFSGLRVVQVSDIHSGSFDNPEAVAKGVEKILELRPDIIFFTGDLVNNRASEMEQYKEIFSRVKAPMGVYSILGNHDYGDYVPWLNPEAKAKNLDKLKETHREMGWRLLLNEHVILSRDNESIALLGIENWGAKANFPKYGKMEEAYKGLPEKGVPFKILLSHDPSHWDAQVKTSYPDIDLTLSGHTHGMQFGVEIPWLKWSPVQYIYKQWAGLYQDAGQYLYVNRGFGFLGYPGRLGILPEITLLELDKA